MKRRQADIPLKRVLCNTCWARILPITADYTGGFCMPCFHKASAARNAELRLTPVEVKEGFCELYSSSDLRNAKKALKALEKHRVPYQCIPGKRLDPHQGGPRNIETVRIFVHVEDKVQASMVIGSYQPTNAIRNCKVDFKYVCPKDWDELERTGEAATRFCQECRQNVFFCLSDREAITHARQGHCIAMAGEDGSARGLLRMGRPPPLTREEQNFVDAYSRDQAKTRALQSLKDSSRFCATCGYPLGDEAIVCGVCGAKVRIKLGNKENRNS